MSNGSISTTIHRHFRPYTRFSRSSEHQVRITDWKGRREATVKETDGFARYARSAFGPILLTCDDSFSTLDSS